MPHESQQAQVEAFIAKWTRAQGAERANKDSFLNELCDLLEVPRADPAGSGSSYVFEFPVPFPLPGGKTTTKFVDLYKAGHFVLEAKQGSNASGQGGIGKRGTPGWTAEMNKAHGQALGYAHSVAEAPPFVVVADLGYCFDLYAQFDGSRVYRPFPSAQKKRIFVADLVKPEVRDTLRALVVEPLALDPSRRATRITREVAGKLGELAKELEASAHSSEQVARFLMRCLFTMFAEDVGLLPGKPFTTRIESEWTKKPERFVPEVRALWEAMDKGGTFGFGDPLLKFNGGLFKNPVGLPLTPAQLALLLECAKCDWSQVEPSIFGTLLERALSSKERHKLGAHYTPRAYVERLVRPTIEEPLRAEWDAIRIAANKALENGKPAQLKKARTEVVAFHTKLCNTRVLDPACGTGNFLYVAFDLFKRLEGEVLALERELTDEGQTLGIDALQISPRQFLGIEVKPWAKQIAELVLWIGYLQWHFRTRGTAKPDEPVLREYDNVECRDAVLDWDDKVPALDDDGKPLTRWDGETMKVHPVTGKEVPDESARVPVWKYVNPLPAKWPEAEFIVGNPPFIGTKRMRQLLGDGYVDALRTAYEGEVEDSADFVMFWWNKAGRIAAAKAGRTTRFGFITTNSITQNFNRRVVEACLGQGLKLVWAIPDHPWVDSESGASVRVAMTAASRPTGRSVVVATVTDERPAVAADGEVNVTFAAREYETIHPDLSGGANVVAAQPLTANGGVSGMGVALHGHGFVLTPDEMENLGRKHLGTTVRRYIAGRDLLQLRRERYVIDFSFMSEEEARKTNGAAFQHVLDTVKPERDENRRESIRRLWWRFGWERPLLRDALKGLPRFIVTTETSRNRVFGFLAAEYLADHGIVVIASDEAAVLGVLSSRVHVTWATRAGGRLGVGNDPRYNKVKCFDPFPFPSATDAQKARIRALAEELDAHRKHQLALNDEKVKAMEAALAERKAKLAMNVKRKTPLPPVAKVPRLTITGMYNVLEKLRAGEALDEDDKALHAEGLVSVLKDLHDRLDAAVFEAYGWPADLTDEQIVERLVALNAERAAEEKRGLVRWLRPEFQNPAGQQTQTALPDDDDEATEAAEAPAAAPVAWPKTLPERLPLVRDAVQARGVVTAAELAKALRAKKPAEIVEVLDGLALLGQLVGEGVGDGRTWSVVGR